MFDEKSIDRDISLCLFPTQQHNLTNNLENTLSIDDPFINRQLNNLPDVYHKMVVYPWLKKLKVFYFLFYFQDH